MNSTFIKKILNKNEFLYCLGCLVKHRKDSKYLEMASLKQIETYYKLSNNIAPSGTTYYLINNNWNESGFFAIIRNCLIGCTIADCLGMAPAVFVYDSLFNVPGGYAGTDNMFEYYFESINSMDLKSLVNNENYIKYDPLQNRLLMKKFRCGGENGTHTYLVNDDYLQFLGLYANKYIVIKKDLLRELNTEILCIGCNINTQTKMAANNKILGVHFRGSDYALNIKEHPRTVTIENYFSQIDSALQNGYDKVFLATDDALALKMFVDRYDRRIVYFKDIARSTDSTGTHMHCHNRDNDQYYLGREVLRDMLALSYCDGLIAGLSQVSLYARIQKFSYGKKYELEHIFDRGINEKTSSTNKTKYLTSYKKAKRIGS